MELSIFGILELIGGNWNLRGEILKPEVESSKEAKEEEEEEEDTGRK